jgi:hypothetical protein
MSKNLRSINVCGPGLKTMFANRREQLLMRELCHGSLNTMRKTLHCTIFLLLLCGGAQAQLTVFNVSSSEITDQGKISAQQQFEIGDQVESSTTASFGPDHRYQIAAGPYLGSHGYLSDGAVMGFQTGIDAGIWYEKLHFLADWVSGSHSKGRLTVGFGVFLSDRLPLSVGWQRSNSDGAQAAVLQLTLLPK